MSGGSWNYAYSNLDDIAGRLDRSREPLRRAMAPKVRALAKALHDIEWVDSADYAPGDEEAAIRAFLTPADEAASVVSELRELLASGSELLARLTPAPASPADPMPTPGPSSVVAQAAGEGGGSGSD